MPQPTSQPEPCQVDLSPHSYPFKYRVTELPLSFAHPYLWGCRGQVHAMWGAPPNSDGSWQLFVLST